MALLLLIPLLALAALICGAATTLQLFRLPRARWLAFVGGLLWALTLAYFAFDSFGPRGPLRNWLVLHGWRGFPFWFLPGLILWACAALWPLRRNARPIGFAVGGLACLTAVALLLIALLSLSVPS